MQPRHDDSSRDLHRTLSPTLLIGLGGTGTEALLRVRRLFFERYGHTGFPIIGYLALDTEKGAFSKVEWETSELVLRNIRFRQQADIPESIDCSITQQEFEQYFRGGKPQHPHIFRWMLPEMDQYGSSAIVDGAGQNRSFGRLAFFHHFHQIRDALKARIAYIVKEAFTSGQKSWLPKDADVEHNRLDVVVNLLPGGRHRRHVSRRRHVGRHLIHTDHGLARCNRQLHHYAVMADSYVQQQI